MGAGETQGNRVSVNLRGSKMGTELEFREPLVKLIYKINVEANQL